MARTITVGATGRDYATLTALVSDAGTGIPADPDTDSQDWDIVCYNDNGSAIVETGADFSSMSTSSYGLTIRAATGTGAGGTYNNSGRDRGTSTALRFDASEGVAFSSSTGATLTLSGDMSLEGIQVTCSHVGSRCLEHDIVDGVTIEGCIFQCTNAAQSVQLGSTSTSGTSYFQNNVVIEARNSNDKNGINCFAKNVTIRNNTLVGIDGSVSAEVIKDGAGTPRADCYNNAFFNFNTDITADNIDYSATNLAAPTGANSVGSLTESNVFESWTTDETTVDLRFKSTATSLVAGDSGNAPSDDYYRATRSGTTTIGHMEIGSGSSSVSITQGRAIVIDGNPPSIQVIRSRP